MSARTGMAGPAPEEGGAVGPCVAPVPALTVGSDDGDRRAVDRVQAGSAGKGSPGLPPSAACVRVRDAPLRVEGPPALAAQAPPSSTVAPVPRTTAAYEGAAPPAGAGERAAGLSEEPLGDIDDLIEAEVPPRRRRWPAPLRERAETAGRFGGRGILRSRSYKRGGHSTSVGHEDTQSATSRGKD